MPFYTDFIVVLYRRVNANRNNILVIFFKSLSDNFQSQFLQDSSEQ